MASQAGACGAKARHGWGLEASVLFTNIEAAIPGTE